MTASRRVSYLRSAIWLSWGTILMIVLFWVLLFHDGVSQHYFQSYQPIDEYTQTLSQSVEGLRRSVTVDNLFIVLYTSAAFFFLLGFHQPGNGAVVGLSAACYLIAGLIDLGEGMLYVVMGDALRAGAPPGGDLVFFLAWMAMLKWHLAYLGMFILTFIIPAHGIAANALIWSGRLLILPVGILVYTVDPDLKPTMLLARFVLVVLGYLLMIAVARQAVIRMTQTSDSAHSASLQETHA